MRNVIKNKGKHKILGKDKVHSEKIRLAVKGEIEDFVSEEESKFFNSDESEQYYYDFLDNKSALGCL